MYVYMYMYVYVYVYMYVYIYIYVQVYVYIHLIILLINIIPESNKNFLSSILVILLMAITLSKWELNYTPFGVFGAFAPI